MSMPTPERTPERDPKTIDLPARVTTRCPNCEATRTTLALHDNALERACRCPECEVPCEVVAVQELRHIGCSCC